MPYGDPAMQREYARQWIARRRADFFRDKECLWCGSRENLQLDHIDRKEKVSHRIWSWSESRRLAEIEKCQVLCYPCHVVKSGRERLPDHGVTRYMNYRCRCAVCVRAASEARQRRRRARIAQLEERRVANAEVAGS